MISNYLKLAIRNLLRIKEYFVINVFGLAIGMACTILVMLNIRDELRYDNFHPNHDRLFRIYIHSNLDGLESKAAVTSQRFAFGFKEKVPDIEQACRLFKLDRDVTFTQPLEQVLSGKSLMFVDSTFFDLFGFKLLEGDPATCLNAPKSIVLSKTLASQLFPEGALGQIVTVENKKDWTVTGIVEDCPLNTHLSYQALVSMRSIEMPDTAWTSNFLYTYLRLKKGSDVNPSSDSELKLSPVERRIMDVFLGEAKDEILSGLGTTIEDIQQENNFFVLRLQEINDIHLFSTLKYEMSQNVNIRTILILAGISILILLIACINYANLSTARLAGRVREIGIRKTLGSHTGEIAWQFLAESVIISFISLFFALVLVELAYPHIQKVYSVSSISLQSALWGMSPLIFIFTLIVGILAGIYPAFYITRFSPSEILRRQKQFGGGNKGIRGLLVILQFVFSIVIIYSTTTIYRQLRFIQSKGVGFKSDNIFVLENSFTLGEKQADFTREMLALSGVEEVSCSNSVPGKMFNMQSFQSGKTLKNLFIAVMVADSSFFDTYGMTLLEGTSKCNNLANDSGYYEVVINEALKATLGLEKAEGAIITRTDFGNQMDTFVVRGVVKDFNYESLHTKIQPLIIIPQQQQPNKFFSIKTSLHNQRTISEIKSVWNKYLPEKTFSGFWVNEEFGLFYGEERITGQIAMFYSFFAIFIACMGLYSLLALTTVYRTKEIGIRKVLGAGPKELILMLTKEIMRLIIIAGLIALPISYLISDYWLSRFAYHVNFNLLNYLLVFLAVFFVAIFTIYRQLWRTINADPSESLRCE